MQSPEPFVGAPAAVAPTDRVATLNGERVTKLAAAVAAAAGEAATGPANRRAGGDDAAGENSKRSSIEPPADEYRGMAPTLSPNSAAVWPMVGSNCPALLLVGTGPRCSAPTHMGLDWPTDDTAFTIGVLRRRMVGVGTAERARDDATVSAQASSTA